MTQFARSLDKSDATAGAGGETPALHSGAVQGADACFCLQTTMDSRKKKKKKSSLAQNGVNGGRSANCTMAEN